MAKIIIFIFVAILSAAPSAADKILAKEGLSLSEDIKIVYGVGRGTTEEAALKNAMRDVMANAVGVYVRSDFRMKNERIIENEVISHSAGYIEHYTKVSEDREKDGIISISIKAWVKVRDFTNDVRRLASASVSEVDGVLLDFDGNEEDSAELLLRKEFRSFNPVIDLMEVKLVSCQDITEEMNDDVKTYRYVYTLSYSPRKYNEGFFPRMQELLDQIAEKKGAFKIIKLTVQRDDFYPHLENYGNWRECSLEGFAYIKSFLARKKPPQTVSIVKSVPKFGILNVQDWQLSKRLYRVYRECRENYTKRAEFVNVVMSVKDVNDIELASSSVSLPTTRYHFGVVGDLGHQLTSAEIDFLPMICRWDSRISKKDNGMAEYFDSYIGYIDITISKSDVPKIKKSTIKLEGGF